MRRSNLIKKVENRIYFKIFVALLWAQSILLEYVRGGLLKLPLLSSVADYIVPCALFIVFMMGFKTMAERLRGQDFVFVMICLVVYVFEFWIYKRNRDYFRVCYTQFVIGALPFYFVGVALRGDDEEILKLLYRISCVTIIAFAFYVTVVNRMDSLTLMNGDMTSSYNLLPHACLAFYYMVKKFRWYRLAILILATISLLLMGTRGSIVCFLLFMMIVTALSIRFKKPILLLIFVLVGGILVSFRGIIDHMIELAYDIAEVFGLSTRVFDKLMSGNFTISSSRVLLKQRIQYYLHEYPIVGLGIYGDLFVTEGMYAHNFFLEVYAHYGYLIGTILTLSLTAYIGRSVIYAFQNKDENAKLISLLLLCCCFKLMVSSSYLKEPFFWLMLGYCASLLRERHSKVDALSTSVEKRSKFIR